MSSNNEVCYNHKWRGRGLCPHCLAESNKVVSPDANVESLRDLLLKRSQVGLQKYGVTTMRTDLTLREWLQHALEETLDKAVYLRAAIRQLEETANDGK